MSFPVISAMGIGPNTLESLLSIMLSPTTQQCPGGTYNPSVLNVLAAHQRLHNKLAWSIGSSPSIIPGSRALGVCLKT